jgi:hypothetical protein
VWSVTSPPSKVVEKGDLKNRSLAKLSVNELFRHLGTGVSKSVCYVQGNAYYVEVMKGPLTKICPSSTSSDFRQRLLFQERSLAGRK